MTLLKKLLGTLLFTIAAGILYLELVTFCNFSALDSWVAVVLKNHIRVPGDHFGITLIVYIAIALLQLTFYAKAVSTGIKLWK